MTELRPGGERGHADHGWLDALKTDSRPIVLERGQGAEVLLFDLPAE